MTDASAEILSVSEVRFVSEIALGKSGAEAARAAGYSSRNAATRLMHRPEIVAAIEAEKAKIREHTLYDVDKAMAETDKAIEMSRETRNPAAMVKAIELRAKLNGLLVDRRADVTDDLNLAEALAAAKRRAPASMGNLERGADGEYRAVSDPLGLFSAGEDSIQPTGQEVTPWPSQR